MIVKLAQALAEEALMVVDDHGSTPLHTSRAGGIHLLRLFRPMETLRFTLLRVILECRLR